MFDPDKLKTKAGKKELYDLARHYYQVTHDAIRRYDPHHLIMGDRYEANMPLPIEVVNASEGLVDVLSFQDFKAPDTQMLEWHKKTGHPVLCADGAQGAAPSLYAGAVALIAPKRWAATAARRD